MRGWFELRTVHDLLGKLKRDLEKLRQEPHDIDLAFNFFVTAEHLLDWQHPGNAGKAERNQARKNDVLLQITSHLANGAKHFQVEANRHRSVKEADRSGGSWPKGYWPDKYWPPGYWGDQLYVELDEDARTKLGSRVAVLNLAESVLRTWEARLVTTP